MFEKGFKYRIYPNKSQEKQLQVVFRAKRFVWNHFLSLNKERLENDEKILTYNKMSSLLTQLKRENEWLKQSEKSVLQNTLKDLYKAFKGFFKKRRGFPKFKSRYNNYHSCKMSYTNNNIEIKMKEAQYTSTGKFKKQNCKVKLPKIKNVKIAYSRQYEGRIVSATVSQDTDGKYYVSLCCVEIPNKQLEKTNATIGVDLGIKKFATTSDNKVISNPKYYRKYESKLIAAQRKLSKRKKKGENRSKQRLIVNRYHKKIYNSRIDFLQKLTTELIKNYDVICLEDLNTSGILKNHKLAKSIADASFFEFKRELEYKANWYDKTVVKINRFYPSSQICSNCGEQSNQTKDLGVRNYICENCGLEIDRDYNASINILNEGMKILYT